MVQKKMWNSLLNHSIWGCLIWTRDGVKSWGSWVAARPEGLVKANALLAEALCHCHIHVSPCPLQNTGNSLFGLMTPQIHLLNFAGWNYMGRPLTWTFGRLCKNQNCPKQSNCISMAFESIEKCSNPCWLGAMPPNARGIAGYTKLCMVAGTGWRALGSGYRPRHEPSGC